MVPLAWSEWAASIALAGLAVHTAYRLYRTPFEAVHLYRVNPENLLFGFIALALWALGVVGVVFLAGNELFSWGMPKIFGVFARSQCAFFVVLWGAKMLCRSSITPSVFPIEAARRCACALIAAAWLCGLMLCIKWYGYSITDDSQFPCPIFVLQLLMGAALAYKAAQESRPGGVLSPFVTLSSSPTSFR